MSTREAIRSTRPDDGAQPADGPGFPLVMADLERTADGTLWFSGLPEDREGHPGQGWVGYRLAPGERRPDLVAWLAYGHVFSPRAAGPGSVQWNVPPAGSSGEDCLGGRLVTTGEHGRSHISWVKDGREVRLTDASAYDRDPTCDPSHRRVWFLSDRGVGVRASRLWGIPLPSERAAVSGDRGAR